MIITTSSSLVILSLTFPQYPSCHNNFSHPSPFQSLPYTLLSSLSIPSSKPPISPSHQFLSLPPPRQVFQPPHPPGTGHPPQEAVLGGGGGNTAVSSRVHASLGTQVVLWHGGSVEDLRGIHCAAPL